jgi:tetratricopeptide (TPR) repeat protein
LQWTVAWNILKTIAGPAAPDERRFLASHPAIRVDALESYIRGLMATAADQRQKLFSNAVVLEPAFSQPCFQLGMLYSGRKEYRLAGNWFQKVAPHDVHYHEAQFRLALARHQTGDFKTAREALERIVHEVPLPEVWNNLGAAQLRLGDNAAVPSFLKALDTDPGDPAYHFNAGLALWRAGEFGPAAERLRAALDRDPADQVATLLLGRCIKKSPARRGGAEAFERLKTEYNEAAWQYLKAMVRPKEEKP